MVRRPTRRGSRRWRSRRPGRRARRRRRPTPAKSIRGRGRWPPHRAPPSGASARWQREWRRSGSRTGTSARRGLSVSTPPSSSPTEVPLAAIALKMPNALGRSGESWKVMVSSDSADGASSAPNDPCSARAAISTPNDGREPAEGRRASEPEQSGDERPLAAEQVTELAAEQQQASEGQRVGSDDPLPVVGRELQGPLRRWQRDIHDRHVEHDHQLRHAEQRQDRPPIGRSMAGARRGGRLSSGTVHPITTTYFITETVIIDHMLT